MGHFRDGRGAGRPVPRHRRPLPEGAGARCGTGGGASAQCAVRGRFAGAGRAGHRRTADLRGAGPAASRHAADQGGHRLRVRAGRYSLPQCHSGAQPAGAGRDRRGRGRGRHSRWRHADSRRRCGRGVRQPGAGAAGRLPRAPPAGCRRGKAAGPPGRCRLCHPGWLCRDPAGQHRAARRGPGGAADGGGRHRPVPVGVPVPEPQPAARRGRAVPGLPAGARHHAGPARHHPHHRRGGRQDPARAGAGPRGHLGAGAARHPLQPGRARDVPRAAAGTAARVGAWPAADPAAHAVAAEGGGRGAAAAQPGAAGTHRPR